MLHPKLKKQLDKFNLDSDNPPSASAWKQFIAAVDTLLNRTDSDADVRDALRETEDRFRAITESAKDAIIMMDNRGRITFWNSAAEKMFGYPRSEAVGSELHPLISPEQYRSAAAAGMDEFFRSGRGEAIGKSLELTANHKAGHTFPIEISLSGISIKGEWHAVGIIRDITERKEAELSLRKSQTHLDTLLTSIPDAVLYHTGSNRYISSNVESMLGYPADRFLEERSFSGL